MRAVDGRWTSRAGDVVVCLATACNGLGFNARQTWAWRRAEIAAVTPSPFRDARGDQISEVSVQTLAPSLFGAARVAALAGLAFEDVARALEGAARGASVAVALGAPSLPSASAGLIASLRARLDATGARVAWAEHAGAHASFAAALVATLPCVERGEVDLAVVGAADSYHDPDLMAALLEEGRVLHGSNAEAMIPGEGAAFVLLARAATARRFGFVARAGIESASYRDDAGLAGHGMTVALAEVFEGVRTRGQTVDWWLHDLTGEPFRARELALWLPRASAGTVSADARMESLPMLLGDLGAATMPTAAAIAVEGFSRSAVDATRCVLLGSSPSGARGAVVLTRGG